MTQAKEPVSPFLEVQDALAVAAIINRFAASFDAKEALSLPEARVLFVLIVRAMHALLSGYPTELKQLVSSSLVSDDEPDLDDSN